MPKLSSSCKTPIPSKRKSVFLHGWWLIEVEGDSKLGVGGFTNREALGTRGMRLFGSASIDKSYNRKTSETGIQVFGSAAIAKRHNNNTLETIDGITITISGCINRSRTQHNGFPPEVCNRFLSGFPHNWEDYAAKSCPNIYEDTTDIPLPDSFDDCPVTHVRDLLMSATTEYEECAFTSIIFRDILKQTESIIRSREKVPESSRETEAKHVASSSLLNVTEKVTEEAEKNSHEEITENSKETEAEYKEKARKSEKICSRRRSKRLKMKT